MKLHILEKIFLGLLVAGLVAGGIFIWVKYPELKTGIKNQNAPEATKVPSPAKNDSGTIEVSSPLPQQTIGSPVSFSGRASGWYFEGSFPVRVYDADGSLLGASIATAQSDWMTADMVEFKGSVSFSAPKGKTGSIMFLKDNPSGLPENDENFIIPIKFK